MKSKWTTWYENQNEATRAYLDAQTKADMPLIYHGMGIGFLIGFFVGFLVFIG